MSAKLPNKKLFDNVLKHADKGKTPTEIAHLTGQAATTVRYWLKHRKALSDKFTQASIVIPAGAPVPEAVILKDKIRTLEAQIKAAAKEQLDAHYVRTKIFKLAESESLPPNWLIKPGKGASAMPGVPTLMLSDWHWGEIIDPTQIGGVNMYNVALAHERARLVVANAIKLLKEHVVNPNYPGIVLILGGDMVSGDIHEELVATNEMEIMPTVRDLQGVLRWVIAMLANAFGKVIVECVSGNHGRNTHKIRAKGRAFTSFDWLLYQWLETSFNPVDPITGKKGAGYDDRVQFVIPNGPDLLYKVFDYRYLLTHGDQFRGGDSMIGCLGPLTRGDHKKRSRNSQVDMAYDTMVVGHYHTLMMLKYLIVNGSLCGYNEYAFSNNFKFEPPQQALWLTHPDHGITISMPVFATGNSSKPMNLNSEWVSWKDDRRKK